ncbi:MAG: hypothetical protein D6761_01880 [Candidatus Dadabacteria bacterium]|nr:MAG: hypothetical protein D6761_01880 [Candidatus Dadabacteria bacterium]
MQLTPVLALLLALTACQPTTLGPRLTADPEAAEVASLLLADLDLRESGANRPLRSALHALRIHFAYDDALEKGAFSLQGSPDAGYSVAAADLTGWQYGAYELIERGGVVFVHPEQTWVPPSFCLECIGTVDETTAPVYRIRGTHIHTMHPIEYESTLLGTGPLAEIRFQRLVAWLLARRQNYLEWNLLRTVDADAWMSHATTLVDIAHRHGMLIGIVAPTAFRQQNSWFLVNGDDPRPALEQIRDGLDWLMQAGWDYVNVEMGASEFFSVPDTEQVSWLNEVARHLDESWHAKTATKVHATVNQTAPGYGDINFNYIAKFADPRMGVMPHTVQFYDLYRPAPTYDRTDFSDLRDFLYSQIGTREVLYYPETAYWVTFDIDVPLFLPEYIEARFNDLYRLRDSGMDGQINFSSGFEWAYWLNDFAAAWFAYDPGTTWTTPLERALSPLGSSAPDAVALLSDVIRWQGQHLLEQNGIRWLIAWDAADDIGHFVDIHGQPSRIRLYELAASAVEELHQFEDQELAQMARLRDDLEDFADRWDGIDVKIPADAVWLFDEIAIGLRATALRAAYIEALYRGVHAHELAERTGNTLWRSRSDEAFEDAATLLDQALSVVDRQRAQYRFPFDEIAVDRASFTSYPFGYLRTVHDLWYWRREWRMATDRSGFNFWDSLYDLPSSSGL